jgi:hypothetical protein
MRSVDISGKLLLAVIFGFGAWGCSNSSGSGGGSGGTSSPPAGSGGSASGGSSSSPSGSGGATTAVPSGGTTSSGGAPGSGGSSSTGGVQASGGSSSPTGGSATGGASSGSGGSGRGGATTGSGGSGRGGATTGSGGAGAGGTSTTSSSSPGTGGATVDGGGTTPGDGCVIGTWPTADPSKAGPYKTVTENDVGPEAGDPGDAGTAPRFTMFRPDNLAEVELCHPVITWGNGTGATPSMYGTLLRNFASHGIVVIASNNTNVARGNPAPMIVGVTWVLEQNEDPTSVLYHRIDTTHIGATGHSQGAMATTTASGDSHITTSIPIEGANVQRNLHGPAMFFCGGQDTLVGCSGAQSALNAVTTLPAMYAELIAVDHGSWMSRGSTLSVADTAFTAWMRVHLLGDTELRSWFYGADCKLCTDSAWNIDRKNMDQ